MANNTKNGERLKLALIPVLGLILLFVATGGEEESASSSPASSADEASVAEAKPEQPKANTAQVAHKAVWPHQSLNTIIAHNPLELNDPRVEVAKAFADAGITSGFFAEPMTEFEFFPELNPALRETVQFAGVRYLFEWNDALRKVEATVETESVAASEAAADRKRSALNDIVPEIAEPQSSKSIDMAILRQRLRTLQGQPVRMFMKTRHGNSVLLGPRRISEGEIIDEGIRVSSITRKGVKFEIVEETSQPVAPQASVPANDRKKL